MLMFEVLKQFNLYDKIISVDRFGNGLLNQTYIAKTDDGSYIIQLINNNTFKNPADVVKNIINITDYCAKLNPEQKNPFNIDQVYSIDNERFPKIDNVYAKCYRIGCKSKVFMKVVNEKMMYEIGKGVGRFHVSLNDFPMKDLKVTLPTLHDAKYQYDELMNHVYEDDIKKAIPLFNEVQFVINRQNELTLLNRFLDEKKIPLKAIHNSLRYNNFLFDPITFEVKAIFGFDAIMPGSRLHDLGDAIRFFASTTREDNNNLEIVKINMKFFKQFIKGYYEAAKTVLTQSEIDLFVDAVKIMALERGLRFLNDYFNDNLCQKVDYNEQNLDCTNNQFKLVQEVEANYEEMKKIVNEITQKD